MSVQNILFDCLLCGGSFQAEARTQLPCGHIFHAECITPHMQANGMRCPRCRLYKKIFVTLLVSVAVGGATTAIISYAIIHAMLEGIGFSAVGPVAGSFAARMQSLIGNVRSRSLFAIYQSIGMGGAIPIVWTVTPGVVVGIIAGIVVWQYWDSLEDLAQSLESIAGQLWEEIERFVREARRGAERQIQSFGSSATRWFCGRF
ncbi:hypothetical protein WOLCODRAFT_17328 [Wolfiporia cocos MD-104 SS10]|uniref:RING-type domain-containing protein n=1 Tax=Wolfiporia cocos (strain MD-104) TaxID=742152 RepID=A0A2H3JVB4_WOLCO|nr:hypothetical protein WOLCODRAFT_17328 [Wolfiporia cocos MD-104 SS10]